MNLKELDFLETKITKLVTENKNGISLETVLEYLDYVNKVNYNEEQIIPVLEKLMSEGKISKNNGLYIAP